MEDSLVSAIASSRFDPQLQGQSVEKLREGLRAVSSVGGRDLSHAAIIAQRRNHDYANCVPFVAMILFLFAALLLLFCLMMPTESPFY